MFVSVYDRIFRCNASGDTQWVHRVCRVAIENALQRVRELLAALPGSDRALALVCIRMEFCLLLKRIQRACLHADRSVEFTTQPIAEVGEQLFASVLSPVLAAHMDKVQALDFEALQRGQLNQVLRTTVETLLPNSRRALERTEALVSTLRELDFPLVFFPTASADFGTFSLEQALQIYMRQESSISNPWPTTLSSQVQMSFTNLDHVGGGAYGQVFSGIHAEEQKVYAIKQIWVGVVSKHDLAEITQEARLLATLKHDHVVGYHTFWRDREKQYLYLQMESCASTLEKGIRQFWQPEVLAADRSKQLWSWFIQLTDALHYLHVTKIRHGDLKSKNILLDAALSVKVADFGLARSFVPSQAVAAGAMPAAASVMPSNSQSTGLSSQMNALNRGSSAIGAMTDMSSMACVLVEMFYPDRTEPKLSQTLLAMRGDAQSGYSVIKKCWPENDDNKQHVCKLISRLTRSTDPGAEKPRLTATELRSKLFSLWSDGKIELSERGVESVHRIYAKELALHWMKKDMKDGKKSRSPLRRLHPHLQKEQKQKQRRLLSLRRQQTCVSFF